MVRKARQAAARAFGRFGFAALGRSSINRHILRIAQCIDIKFPWLRALYRADSPRFFHPFATRTST